MKVGIYTLGCKVNAYESEYIASLFRNRGYTIASFDDDCDVYVINTCTVTNNSDKKDKKIINQININYDGNIVEYTPDKFINFRHGYAISIHKAQGSEFDMVIMPVVNSFKRMLYNKLVYTGVTRAKKSLVIVGDSNAFIYGINNDYVDNRKTTLKDFIINFYNE